MPVIENWKLVVLQRYALFEGRSNRAEFWWYALANFIVGVVLLLLSAASTFFLVIYVIWAIALLVPSIAVGFRRLQDAGYSAWLLLLGLVPFGGIALIILWAMPGTVGPNKHGDAPLPSAG
jgi:uncharacterized membrane protein YhaH (DUF805 family)